MKTQNFWKTLLMSAALLISGAMVSCDKEEETPSDFEAQISTNLASTTVDAAPGDVIDFTVTANTDWTATTDDANNILTLSKSSGSEGSTSVSATISSSASYGQKATVTLTAKGYIMGFEYPVSETITFNLKDPNFVPGDGSLEHPFSVEEVIAKCNSLGADVESSEAYYIKGIVTEIKEPFNNSYGNGTFYIGDTANATEKFYVYRIYYLNNKKWTSGDTDIQVGDNVVVCSKIVNYKGNTPETVQNTGYLYSLNGVTGNGGDSGEVTEPEHAGTADDPYTVADAINKAKITGETATEEAYYIKGLVKSITEQFSAQYGNATFTMVDEGSNNVFTAYRILYLNNEKWTTGGEVMHEGDEVIVCGQIVNYYGNTPETAQNSGYLYKIVSCTGYEEPTPDPVPDNVNFQSDSPFVCSADDSASASYTLGSSTFNGKSASGFKLGTGSKSGKFTSAAVGVAGDCTLSLYAVAWKGQAGTLKVSVAGGGSIEGTDKYELKSNNGATGNAPFTVTDLTQADYYTFSIKGLTANSTISFETVDGTYRAVVAGVHLTGGTATEPDPGTDPDPDPDDPGVETGKGSVQDPFTVAEAIAKAEQTGETETSEAYYIKGIVKSVGQQFSAQYGNATFAMIDEGSDKEFTAYRVLYLNNQKWVEGNDTIGVGDVVIVCGKIVNYKGNTPETAQNSGYLYQIVEKGTGKLPGEEESTDGKAVFNFANAGYENAQDITSAKEGPITATFDGGGNNNTPKYYTTGSAIRLYAKNSVTFSGATITSIEFKFSSGEGTNEITADSGTYKDGKWTGSATSVKFTVGGTSGHRRVASVIVEYK